MAEISDILPGCSNVQEYTQNAIKSMLMCTKAGNKLPTDEDYQYYETFKGFRTSMASTRKQILSLMASLIPGNAARQQFMEMDLDEQFDIIKNINSSIFETLESQLDEISGKKKQEHELISVTKPAIAIDTSWNRTNLSTKKSTISLLSAKNIPRPQLKFKTKVDNSNAIFIPILKEKPNSIKPLAITLEQGENGEEFCHPYEWEIEKFQPGEDLLQLTTPTLPRPLAETPLIMVNTEESLKAMCADLKAVKEFAVDVEHHSYRSFQGLSCLIQISTRDQDYIVDAISLRSELWILNEVLTDPKITKVLHGADMDVLWLQRDFGLYIVNLFDTGQAARVLSFPHLSLLYLLKHYCNINLDKRYQLADWRMRPLPEELLKYAREDTHYLLYIYDCMKNDLINKGNKNLNLLVSVFQRSKEICLKKYEKVLLTDDSYLELYKKSKKSFNAQQLYCLKELYAWRDKIARIEDESYAYVLPNHMLLQIAEVLPREHQGILACCNPVPPFVRMQLNELHMIIAKATMLPISQIQEKLEIHVPILDEFSIDLNNILQCPHDIHLYGGRTEHELHLSGNRINVMADLSKINVQLKEKPTLNLDESTSERTGVSSAEIAKRVREEIAENRKTTYERYLLTKEHNANRTEANQEKETPASEPKESDEKSFIEVINPALKVAFASKTPDKSRTSDPYHYVRDSSSSNATPVMSSSQLSEISVESSSNLTPNASLNNSNASSTDTTPKNTNRSENAAKRRRGFNKKKNALSAEDAISDSSSPPKRQKTAAESSKEADDNFQPFNYEATNYNEVLRPEQSSKGFKKTKKSSFDPFQDKSSNFRRLPQRTPKNKKGRKKQKTFAAAQKMDSGSNKKWPKS